LHGVPRSQKQKRIVMHQKKEAEVYQEANSLRIHLKKLTPIKSEEFHSHRLLLIEKLTPLHDSL